MTLTSQQEKWNIHAGKAASVSNDNKPTPFIRCEWAELRAQLLSQWSRITETEIDQTAQNRYRLAHLIERKYGVASGLVENYLLNFERTMPLETRQIRSQ